MGKRTVFEANGHATVNERGLKRQRTGISHERESPVGAIAEDEVTSARQLEKALVFDNGYASSFRSGKKFCKASNILTNQDRPQPSQKVPRFRLILRRRACPTPQARHTPRIPRHAETESKGRKRRSSAAAVHTSLGLCCRDQFRSPSRSNHCQLGPSLQGFRHQLRL
jgi:hypothetical protein